MSSDKSSKTWSANPCRQHPSLHSKTQSVSGTGESAKHTCETFKFFFWTALSRVSVRSISRVGMNEKVTTTKNRRRKDKIDLQIHTECIHSGGAVTVTITVNGANASAFLPCDHGSLGTWMPSDGATLAYVSAKMWHVFSLVSRAISLSAVGGKEYIRSVKISIRFSAISRPSQRRTARCRVLPS